MPKQSDPRKWLRFAEADLAAARSLLATPDLPARIACFHAHQATEKALKASLVASGTPFRKTHDLAILVGLQPEAIRSLLGDVDLELPRVLAGVAPEQISCSTPCASFDVAQLISSITPSAPSTWSPTRCRKSRST